MMWCDIQVKVKVKQCLWDFSKNFEGFVVLLFFVVVLGFLGDWCISLMVNGEQWQEVLLFDMVWMVEELIVDLL